jgi:hypothetical protein
MSDRESLQTPTSPRRACFWRESRKILCALHIIVTIGFASIATYANAETWAEYRPDGIGYSVQMPGAWAVTIKDIPTAVGIVKTPMAIVALGSVVYITAYSPYPPEKLRGKPVTSMLDGARNGVVANGTLRSEEQIIVSTLPGRQIIVETTKHLVLVHRFFIKDNVLVQATVVGPEGTEGQPNTKRFLESLKVVDGR